MSLTVTTQNSVRSHSTTHSAGMNRLALSKNNLCKKDTEFPTCTVDKNPTMQVELVHMLLKRTQNVIGKLSIDYKRCWKFRKEKMIFLINNCPTVQK